MACCKILIIDDDQDDIDLLREVLEKSGVDDVHHVDTAMQAFQHLKDAEPDDLPRLIVTDHYIRGITGLKFLKDFKAMDRYKHIAVIVLCTTILEKESETYYALGADDYLQKPSTYEGYERMAQSLKEKITTPYRSSHY